MKKMLCVFSLFGVVYCFGMNDVYVAPTTKQQLEFSRLSNEYGIDGLVETTMKLKNGEEVTDCEKMLENVVNLLQFIINKDHRLQHIDHRVLRKLRSKGASSVQHFAEVYETSKKKGKFSPNDNKQIQRIDTILYGKGK